MIVWVLGVLVPDKNNVKKRIINKKKIELRAPLTIQVGNKKEVRIVCGKDERRLIKEAKGILKVIVCYEYGYRVKASLQRRGKIILSLNCRRSKK